MAMAVLKKDVRYTSDFLCKPSDIKYAYVMSVPFPFLKMNLGFVFLTMKSKANW